MKIGRLRLVPVGERSYHTVRLAMDPEYQTVRNSKVERDFDPFITAAMMETLWELMATPDDEEAAWLAETFLRCTLECRRAFRKRATAGDESEYMRAVRKYNIALASYSSALASTVAQMDDAIKDLDASEKELAKFESRPGIPNVHA